MVIPRSYKPADLNLPPRLRAALARNGVTTSTQLDAALQSYPGIKSWRLTGVGWAGYRTLRLESHVARLPRKVADDLRLEIIEQIPDLPDYIYRIMIRRGYTRLSALASWDIFDLRLRLDLGRAEAVMVAGYFAGAGVPIRDPKPGRFVDDLRLSDNERRQLIWVEVRRATPLEDLTTTWLAESVSPSNSVIGVLYGLLASWGLEVGPDGVRMIRPT